MLNEEQKRRLRENNIFHKMPKSKIRAKIIRKGMFTQLPYTNKELEHEQRLFRTVIDYALYDATVDVKEVREEIFKWLEHFDFKEVCYLAGLSHKHTYDMFLYFLENFFPKNYLEFCSYTSSKNAIL